MSIEQEAGKDLALGSEEAENVLGGKKVMKVVDKTLKPAAKTYPVGYINVPASAGDRSTTQAQQPGATTATTRRTARASDRQPERYAAGTRGQPGRVSPRR